MRPLWPGRNLHLSNQQLSTVTTQHTTTDNTTLLNNWLRDCPMPIGTHVQTHTHKVSSVTSLGALRSLIPRKLELSRHTDTRNATVTKEKATGRSVYRKERQQRASETGQVRQTTRSRQESETTRQKRKRRLFYSQTSGLPTQFVWSPTAKRRGKKKIKGKTRKNKKGRNDGSHSDISNHKSKDISVAN